VYYGGVAIGYSFKYSLHLVKRSENRYLIVDRAPHIADKSVRINLRIEMDGFYEVLNNEENN